MRRATPSEGESSEVEKRKRWDWGRGSLAFCGGSMDAGAGMKQTGHTRQREPFPLDCGFSAWGAFGSPGWSAGTSQQAPRTISASKTSPAPKLFAFAWQHAGMFALEGHTQTAGSAAVTRLTGRRMSTAAIIQATRRVAGGKDNCGALLFTTIMKGHSRPLFQQKSGVSVPTDSFARVLRNTHGFVHQGKELVILDEGRDSFTSRTHGK